MIFSKWMLVLGVLYLACFSECSVFSTLEDLVKRLFPSKNCQQPDYPKCGDYKTEILPTPTSLLATGPYWDAGNDSLFYTDTRGVVLRYLVDTKQYFSCQVINLSIFKKITELSSSDASTFPGTLSPLQLGVGYIFPTEVPGKYAMNLATGVGFLSWDGKSPICFYEELYLPDRSRQIPFFTIYDGEVGPNGTIFFTLVIIPPLNLLPVNPAPELTPANRSTLFAICNNKLIALLTSTSVNGITFGPSFKKIFLTDSIARLLYCADLDPTDCSISNTIVLIDFAKKCIDGIPDGITTDNKGYLWITFLYAGQILKIDPKTGEILCVIKTPIKTGTNLAFGSCSNETDELGCLFMTSSFFNSTQIDNLGQPINLNEGKLVMISNFGSEGIHREHPKASLYNIIKSKP